MDKKEIAYLLNEIALMLELTGENPFKVNAFYSAARKVELLQEDIVSLVESGAIKSVKGIGPSISKEITGMVQTGSSPLYMTLKEQIPTGLFELLKVPGLGSKKISALYKNLGIDSLAALEEACREKRLSKLPGFGAKTEENILHSMENLKQYIGQHRFADVIGLGLELEKDLREYPGTIRVALAGSLRRSMEVVKDIDLVASSHQPDDLIRFFCRHPRVASVLSAGSTKAAVALRDGINADLRVVSDCEFPYALHHFTGSREHNTAMRHRAKELGLKMNEYGLFDTKDQNIPCRDEEEIFRALGLDFIPPELREDRGEIQAAEAEKLPGLITADAVQGALHIHTVYTDGSNTIEELSRACRSFGWSYLGVSDHSQSAFYAGGMKPDRLAQQWAEIDAQNSKEKSFTVFKGIEADILKDGSLDYPDEILAGFDFVIASIHSGFKMTEVEATHRLVRAMSNPYVTILGHPTGRLLLGRSGYPVDMKRIIDAARDYRVAVEMNASPYRMDIDWRWCSYAKEQGVKIAINPDAHSLEELSHTLLGIGMARKGWLESRDVVNTLSAAELRKFFQSKR